MRQSDLLRITRQFRAKMSERMAGNYAWLFGRRTYAGLLASWNAQEGPFKDALNNRCKYVASHNPSTTLDWPNSSLLNSDVPAAVTKLKQTSKANLVILGSGDLIGSLAAADVIDEYLLMIAPVVLGCGRRLFTEGVHASMELVECTPTSTGAIVASYAPAR